MKKQLVRFFDRQTAIYHIESIINDASRFEADNTAIISISNDEEEMNEMIDMMDCTGLAFICIHFPDDVSVDIEWKMEQVFEFIEMLKDRHFVIHCEMGISRSAAVAKFINSYLGLDIPRLNGYDLHNKNVYETLERVAGISLSQYFKEIEQGQ